jgi:hypothetical protein
MPAAPGRKLRRAADLLPRQHQPGGHEAGTAAGAHGSTEGGKGADESEFCQEAVDAEAAVGGEDGFDEGNGAQYEEFGLAGADYEEA